MKWFSCALIVLLVSGCQRNHYDMNDIYAKYGNGSENTAAYIEKAAALKVYFGHQSVGFNIIDGIEKWEAETGVRELLSRVGVKIGGLLLRLHRTIRETVLEELRTW